TAAARSVEIGLHEGQVAHAGSDEDVEVHARRELVVRFLEALRLRHRTRKIARGGFHAEPNSEDVRLIAGDRLPSITASHVLVDEERALLGSADVSDRLLDLRV